MLERWAKSKFSKVLPQGIFQYVMIIFKLKLARNTEYGGGAGGSILDRRITGVGFYQSSFWYFFLG